jgi:hypothetical protein
LYISDKFSDADIQATLGGKNIKLILPDYLRRDFHAEEQKFLNFNMPLSGQINRKTLYPPN